MDSRKKTLTILLALISITSLIAITYAYFGIEVGENQNQEITMNSANLSLKYTDCASSNQEHCNNITASLSPGDELIKTFEIENTGNGPSEFQLYFKELMNTFKNDELVFKIENLETGVVLLEESPVPYNELKVFNVPIELNDTIPAQTTHKYKFTIKFLNTDYEQSENVDAEFIIKLGLLEITPDTTTSNTFTMTLANNSPYVETTNTSATVSWEEEDINSVCLTTASTSTNCSWTKVSGNTTTQNVTLTSGDGEKTIYAYLKDDAGNISSSKAGTIILDTESPTITTNLVSSNGSNDWYNEVVIGGSGVDTGTGVTNIKYCTTTESTCTPNLDATSVATLAVDNTKNATASLSTSNTLAQRICMQATDGTGKKSAVTCSGAYKFDNTPPEITSVEYVSGDSTTLTMQVNVTDNHSGVQTYYYSLNNGSYASSSSNSYTFTGLTAQSEFVLKYKVTDKVGNETLLTKDMISFTVLAGGNAVADSYLHCEKNMTWEKYVSSSYNKKGARITGDSILPYGGSVYLVGEIPSNIIYNKSYATAVSGAYD